MGICASSTATPPPPPGRGGGVQRVSVSLEREMGNLSIGLRLKRTARGVLVRGVDEGSVMARWNAEHPSMEVDRGDRVVEVNGLAVDCPHERWSTIFAEFRRSSVTLAIIRNAVRPRSTGLMPAVMSLDHVLPDDFLDKFGKDATVGIAHEDCAICLESLKEGTAVVLPCRHAFHRACVEQWLSQRPTLRHARCPTCRVQIPLVCGPMPEIASANSGILSAKPDLDAEVDMEVEEMIQNHHNIYRGVSI